MSRANSTSETWISESGITACPMICPTLRFGYRSTSRASVSTVDLRSADEFIVLLVIVPVSRRHQLLVMRVLAREPGPQGLKDRELVAPVGVARDALRLVDAYVEGLAAGLARVDDSHEAAFGGTATHP